MTTRHTMRWGGVPIRFEGEHPVVAWAREHFAPDDGEPAIVFEFVDRLDPIDSWSGGTRRTALVGENVVEFRDRCHQVRMTAGPVLRVQLERLDARPLWLRSVVHPDDAWKMWVSHGSSLDLLVVKTFLYSVLLPVLQLTLLDRDAALVHSSSFALGDRAVVLPALGGVGKSMLVSRAVLRGEARFLADDYAVVEARGTTFFHHLFMHVYVDHMRFDEILRERVLETLTPGGRRQWALAKSIRPARAVRWVDPRDVFGASKLADRAKLAEVIFLCRSRGRDFDWRDETPGGVARRCAGVISNELKRMPSVLAAAQTGWSDTPLPTLGEFEHRYETICATAFAEAKCAMALIPRKAPADEIVSFLAGRSETLGAIFKDR